MFVVVVVAVVSVGRNRFEVCGRVGWPCFVVVVDVVFAAVFDG